MLLDTIHGIIDRRILLNFRIDPDAIRRVLPPPFKPKLFRDHAIGGVCMIRFKNLRPRFVPAVLGMDSENAAHRIAVTWEENGTPREGVFIPQRNTASKFNKVLGGRVFPGVFSLSRFDVQEFSESLSIRIFDSSGEEQVRFSGTPADTHSPDSIFPTLSEAANFFSLGGTGYSAQRDQAGFEGMELRSLHWKVAPLKVTEAYSRWFTRPDLFPPGAVSFDCALIMRNIPHEWHSRPRLSPPEV